MDTTGFDWSDLVFFLELARQGRLMPAARRLRADHTTVSRRIAELERSLHCKLFDRNTNGFVLTDVGQKLFSYAEAMETNALAIAEQVGGIATEPSGRVRIATMEGLGSFYLAPRICKLRESFPEIRVELVTERHLINLTKREADISLSFSQMKAPRLLSEKIGTFELRLYASPSYIARKGLPTGTSELDSHDFVDYIDDMVAIPEVRWLHEVLVPTHIVFESSSMIAQHNAAVAGVGIVLLPSFNAALDTRLIPILVGKVSVKRAIWLTVHEDHQYLSRIKTVKRFLEETIGNDQAFLNGVS
jgi:DNA-binding transcriptional LysR family regulator